MQRYIAAAIKDVERLSSILSQNEFAIYRRYIREQSNRGMPGYSDLHLNSGG